MFPCLARQKGTRARRLWRPRFGGSSKQAAPHLVVPKIQTPDPKLEREEDRARPRNTLGCGRAGIDPGIPRRHRPVLLRPKQERTVPARPSREQLWPLPRRNYVARRERSEEAHLSSDVHGVRHAVVKSEVQRSGH